MRVLMLGNSLTTSNHMPDMLRFEEGQLDNALEVVVHARGGARLAEHLNPNTKLGARTQETLSTQPWDFVIMQEMSHGPATSPQAYMRSVEGLSRLIRQAGATPVIYGTWAYAPGCPKLEKLGFDYRQMHDLMQESFSHAAQATKALLANAGLAFYEFEKSDLLYKPDGVHPSELGSQMAAQVILQAILKE